MPQFTPEWRLLGPTIDLEALRLYLKTVEQQLALLRDEARVRLTADQKDANDWLWYESQMREAYVTKSLRGGFIMSLWASYESGVLEVANFLEKEKGMPQEFPRVSGADPVDQAQKYFDSELGFPLHPGLAARGRSGFPERRILPPPIYLDSRLARRVGVQREGERICPRRGGRGKRPEVVEGRSCRSDGVQGGRRM